MKDCQTMVVELPGFANGSLAAEDAAVVDAHVRACASCRNDVAEIRRLDKLLMEALPSVKLSPGFASVFANRLAAEAAAEEAAAEETAKGRSGWLEWVLQPWLVPVAAVSVLAVVLVGVLRLSPWSFDAPSPGLPNVTGPVAKKPVGDAPKVAAGLPDKKGREVAANPPPDVLQRPELFVDYSVIRDLDILESGKGDTESHTG